MKAEIERRFGAGVIEKAKAEAEANWKPEPPMSNWHVVWMIPLLIAMLLLTLVLWPLSHLVAWIRRTARGERKTWYLIEYRKPRQRWDERVTTFMARVVERFLG
jgi:hypothetical protein